MNKDMITYNKEMIRNSKIIQDHLFKMQIDELGKGEKCDLIKYTNIQNISLTWMKTLLALGMVEETGTKVECADKKVKR